MKIRNYAKAIVLTSVIASGFTSCEDKAWENAPAIAEDNTESVVSEQPLVDEVKTTFMGKVAVFAYGDDKIFPYLQKRIPNVVATPDSDVDVVVFDEVGAANALSTDAKIDQLKSLWYKNKGFAFVNPAANALELLNRISGAEMSDKCSQEEIAAYSDINVYIIKADGDSFYHEKIYNPEKDYIVECTTVGVDSLGNEIVNDELKAVEYIPSDYDWGQVAEKAGKWLNENIVLGEDVADMAFSRSNPEENYVFNNVVKTYCPKVTVNHTLVEDVGFGTNPASVTVTPTITVVIQPGYNEQMQCDVYDVRITEEFPADKTFVKDVVTKTKNCVLWKYKYKYSGGCHGGLYVDAYLSSNNKSFSFDSNSVELYEPAPIASPGSGSISRNPGSLSIGTGIKAGVSGKSAVLQGDFSLGYTLPSTTISHNQSDMPVNFSRDNGHAKWDYDAFSSYRDQSSILYDNSALYDWQAGFNPTYVAPAECTRMNCKTEQAVTFTIKDSKKLGTSDVYFNLSGKFKTYHEAIWAWEGYCRESRYPFSDQIEMPDVNRYFEKYTATHYYMTASADSSEWSSLLATLQDDPNYNILSMSGKDENPPLVSAQTEAGVRENAERIWKGVINSLVKSNNGCAKVNNEYVIGLKDSNGDFLPMGLYISKDGTWKMVDDIKAVADSIKNANK